jgi:hypothetical protein
MPQTNSQDNKNVRENMKPYWSSATLPFVTTQARNTCETAVEGETITFSPLHLVKFSVSANPRLTAEFRLDSEL